MCAALSRSRPRTSVRGGADPSTLCGEQIASEEDVLHVKELPTFDGKLSQSSAELLVSFLTVPYIRIPLVINFFASAENINALSHPDMQRLIDSVMFEPGLWQPLGKITVPEMIPAPDRSHLATNCGLLFNELLKSPQGIMDSLLCVLKLAIEQDTGRWTHRSAAVILFVVRLLVRVEGFMIFLINYNRRDKTRINGTGWESYVQGLDTSPTDVDAMDKNRRHIRELLNTQVRSIIDRWIAYCIKKNEMGRVAFLYAHCAFLWYNLSPQDLTPDVAVSFLSSQLFLATRFRGASRHHDSAAPVKRKLAKADAGEMYGNGMQCELFDIFQKHRGMVMAWLLADAPRCNQVVQDSVCA